MVVWGFAAALALAASTSGPQRPGNLHLYTEGPGTAVAQLPDLARLARASTPAVVGVVTIQTPTTPPGHDMLKEFFDRYYAEGPRKGLGTGFVINPEGYIVTNAHVIEGATDIEVELGDDGEHVKARLVGKDDQTDVALLRIDPPEPLPTLPLGDSDRISVAEWVMVIGNPFGLTRSVTIGIVSHAGRLDIAPAGRDGYFNFIQTDASINPGNSGGPLLNMRGEVIGIATAVNATGQGIGFAIPINTAKQILGQLKEHGRVIRSWMGVSVRELSRDPSERARVGAVRGVLVTDVANDGPAAHAGVRSGDVITSYEGRNVRSASRLRWHVSTAGVGKVVGVTVKHGADPERALRVRLAELPPEGTGIEPEVEEPPALPPIGRRVPGSAGD